MKRAPHPLLVNVGRRVAELRAEQGLTQEELAERAELSARYIQRVESGGENLTLLTLLHVADALRVEPADLLQQARRGPAGPGRPPKSGAKPSGRGTRRGASKAAAE